MDLSSSSAKKAESSSEKQINDLADADLAAIFKQLPPYDRLIASEVCRRWHGLIRQAWLDVTSLDLGPVPGKHIGAIVHQCPNLKSVFARKKSFDLNELVSLPQAAQLSTVKLYDCQFAVKSSLRGVNDGFAKIFSQNLQQASWSELILHNACLEDKKVSARDYVPNWAFSAEFLPASLSRLELSGQRVRTRSKRRPNLFLTSLNRLQNLDSFILHHIPKEPLEVASARLHVTMANLCALRNLRELCLGPASDIILGRLIASLPKLQVLFLNNINADEIEEDLKELITMNSVLHILVLSGEFHRPFWLVHPIELPARKRFPNGFGSDALPLLHIFVGKEASERIRFAKSASDAAVVYPINEPMPQFLARADIAPIFEGVWVAEKIKEAAINGGKLWNYELHDAATSVQNI